MEFLLINHPLDCPICDQAGECKLQEQSTGYGRGYSRFIEQKNVKPKRTLLGPRVMLDDERCILCSRCIRFCKEIAKDDVLGFTDRGSYSTLTCYPGRRLENNYSLNTVDICPVGALTSTDFRFKMRVWFLKQTNSIDTESSAGANTVVWSREGVDLPDHAPPERRGERHLDGRQRAGPLQGGPRAGPARLRPRGRGGERPRIRGQGGRRSSSAAGGVAVVGSGRSSRRGAVPRRGSSRDALGATGVARLAGGGGRRAPRLGRPQPERARRARHRPRRRPAVGAASTRCGAQIDSGAVTAVVSIGEDLAAAGLSAGAAREGPDRVPGDPRQRDERGRAGRHPDPHRVREERHVREPAVPDPEVREGGAGRRGRDRRPRWPSRGSSRAAGGPGLGADVGSALGARSRPRFPRWPAMGYAGIPDTGLLLDGAPWAGLPFAEGPGAPLQAGASRRRRRRRAVVDILPRAPGASCRPSSRAPR